MLKRMYKTIWECTQYGESKITQEIIQWSNKNVVRMPNWKMPDKTDKQGYWLKKLCCNHV